MFLLTLVVCVDRTIYVVVAHLGILLALSCLETRNVDLEVNFTERKAPIQCINDGFHRFFLVEKCHMCVLYRPGELSSLKRIVSTHINFPCPESRICHLKSIEK